MPLTEEEVNQVNEGISNGTPLNEIEVLKPLTGVESIVLTTKKQFEDDKTSAVTQAINDRTSKWASDIEKDVFDLTGIEKLPNEKYHEYQKRAVALVKGDPERISQLEGQIEELKKNGKVDPVLQKELEELKANSKKQSETYEQQIEELKNEKVTFIKRNQIRTGVNDLKFKDTLPPDVVQREISYAVNQMMEMQSEVREQDGEISIVFLDENGHAKRNPDNSYMTPKQIAESLLAASLAEERGGKGSGSQAPPSGGGKPETDFGVDFEIPDDISSREELDSFLKQKGISSLSEEYKKITAYYKDVVKLPLSTRFGKGLAK